MTLLLLPNHFRPLLLLLRLADSQERFLPLEIQPPQRRVSSFFAQS